MQIIKVINNNVISSEDDKGKEIIVMGKGIGFGKKAGEEIDETKIEKVCDLNRPPGIRHREKAAGHRCCE